MDGFYDDVAEPTPGQREQYAKVPFDEARYLTATGVPALYGEAGWSTYEREWIRPTLEVNGMWGGFQGDGTKTVLPAAAHAKITCRLVADQQPARILELVADHLRRHAPAGVRVSCEVSDVHGAPYAVTADHPGNRAAAKVLEKLYGVPPLHTGSGGSIPVCGLLREELGIHTIGFSFALDDEGAHGPDEFFRLASFRARTGGILSYPARVGPRMSGPGRAAARNTPSIAPPRASVGRRGRSGPWPQRRPRSRRCGWLRPAAP